MAWGGTCVYLPYPTKSKLVISWKNVVQAKKYFRGNIFKVVTGQHYMGDS